MAAARGGLRWRQRARSHGWIHPIAGAAFSLRAFCTLYFGLNLGAGAFLFTTRRNFEATGGFDEQYFAGEEVYFSLALRKLGRFKGAAGTWLSRLAGSCACIQPEKFLARSLL